MLVAHARLSSLRQPMSFPDIDAVDKDPVALLFVHVMTNFSSCMFEPVVYHGDWRLLLHLLINTWTHSGDQLGESTREPHIDRTAGLGHGVLQRRGNVDAQEHQPYDD